MAQDKYGFPQNLWNTKHDEELESVILLCMDENLHFHKEYLSIQDYAIEASDELWQKWLDDKMNLYSMRLYYEELAEEVIHDLMFLYNEQH
jgi:hypothetical protein